MKQIGLILLAVVCLLAGCTKQVPHTTKELFAMDTVMHLMVYSQEDSVLKKAEEEIRRLEKLLSVTDPNSEIAHLNQCAGEWVTVSQETAELLTFTKEYAKQTDGQFDPTVYPAVQAWGFTTDQKRVPSQEELEGLLPLVDYNQIEIKGMQVRLPKEAGVDLGAIAKGYAADKVKELFEQAGVSGVLSLGGNVLTVGQKPDGTPFSVAIQDPNNAADTLGVLAVTGGQAVVTSGDYQRYFEKDGVRYHHILDPKTAAPAMSDLTSVTVIANSAAKADAYATALFAAGKEQALTLAKTLSVQAVLVTKEKQIIYTSGLNFTPNNADYSVIKAGE